MVAHCTGVYHEFSAGFINVVCQIVPAVSNASFITLIWRYKLPGVLTDNTPCYKFKLLRHFIYMVKMVSSLL